MTTFDFDVSLSFAGEQRTYVEEVALALRRSGLRVFYDDFEKVDLWGKDLYDHLDGVYRRSSRFCVIFASADYARKLWTTHERRSAQARAIQDNEEYILPARFDMTEIPGLRPTVSYILLDGVSPVDLAHLIVDKIGRKSAVVPAGFDHFKRRLEELEVPQVDVAMGLVGDFIAGFRRMSVQERRTLTNVLWLSGVCHRSQTVVFSLETVCSRIALGTDDVRAILSDLTPLGLETVPHVHPGEADLLELSWYPRNFADERLSAYAQKNGAQVARALVRSLNPGCTCLSCALASIEHLDFGFLDSHHPITGFQPSKNMRSSDGPT